VQAPRIEREAPSRDAPSVAQAVTFDSVSVAFRAENSGQPLRVLSDLSFDVPAGQFLALIGASGCGKTTILNLVAGLVTHNSGEVMVLGAPPRVGRADVGYMLARDALLPWRTARQNIELGLELRGVGRRERHDRSAELLDRVGLASASDSYPLELSQGMRQRVALARTWATDPDLLLMDEPFAALDAQTRTSISDEFLRIWDDELQRKTVLFVTHDLSEALFLADRIITIGRGRIGLDVAVPYGRPRDRAQLLQLAEYQQLYSAIEQELVRSR
jgi:NitT/TauT family transport system ATP-binding protein